MAGKPFQLLFSNLSKSEVLANKLTALSPPLHHYCSGTINNACPPDPIPNRPLRGDRRNDQAPRTTLPPMREAERRSRRSEGDFRKHSDPSRALGDEESMDGFLEKFKLRDEKQESKSAPAPPETKTQAEAPPEADEIFRKMKETGLIPNAVAMLDGLCKDGLVQEAMKLFGLMREKGTIPEVVIYTAVVEGFCKAHKLDDAVRIFRKMETNGISPNAFTYTILIQGLYKGRRLDDALQFCLEMLEAGHSPNVAAFAGLVDAFCAEKGVEESRGMIAKLRDKGLAVDDKGVREHLDKKGPFSPLVWEAVFGNKPSQGYSKFRQVLRGLRNGDSILGIFGSLLRSGVHTDPEGLVC